MFISSPELLPQTGLLFQEGVIIPMYYHLFGLQGKLRFALCDKAGKLEIYRLKYRIFSQHFKVGVYKRFHEFQNSQIKWPVFGIQIGDGCLLECGCLI